MKNLIGIQKYLVPNPTTIPHFMWLIGKISDNWVQYLNESSTSAMSRGVYYGHGVTALAATSERQFILVGIDFFRKTLIRVFHICPLHKIALFLLSVPNSTAILNDKRYALKYQRHFLRSWNRHY